MTQISNGTPDIAARIADMVTSDDVVLFMKGIPDIPQCGFSSVAVKILDHLGVSYSAINVLDDDAVRQGIKVYSDWPTIPQLYVRGEFIGGCDIVKDMFENGELRSLLRDKGSADG